MVVRTFSKTWSMAAVRLGYAIADPEVVAACEQVALPYHLSVPTQIAGTVALRFADEMSERVALIEHERERLADGLGELPVDSWPSDANFILFRPRDKPASAVWAGLLDRSVLVRDCSTWSSLAGCLRVTVGTGRGERPVPDRSEGVPSMTVGQQAGGTRRAVRRRSTKETVVDVTLDVDGTGAARVVTGLPFFDHMVEQLGRHGGFDLSVQAEGDLAVDAHHTVEDVGIVLGGCLAEALGDKAGVRRFASLLLPLDEALVEVALDLSGRPYLAYDVELPPTRRGSGRRPSTPSSPRSSGGRSSRRRASRCTCACGRGRTPTTSSRRRSRGWRGRCATRSGSRAGASRPPRAPCDRPARHEHA